MKPVTVEIGGQIYPLVMTVAAVEELSRVCGGIDQINAYLLPENRDGAYDHGAAMGRCIQVLGILIREGEEHRLMEAQCYELADAAQRRWIPDAEKLAHFLTVGQVGRYQKAVFEALTASMAQEIEAEPSKNVESGEPQ